MKQDDANLVVIAGGAGFLESVALSALSVLVADKTFVREVPVEKAWVHDPQKTAAVLNNVSYGTSQIFAKDFRQVPEVLLEWLAINTRQRVDLIIRRHIDWLSLDQEVAEKYGALSVEKFGKKIVVPGLYEKWGYASNDVFEDADLAMYECVEAILHQDPNASQLYKHLKRDEIVAVTRLVIKHGSYSDVDFLTDLWEGKLSNSRHRVPQDVLLVVDSYRDRWVDFGTSNLEQGHSPQAWVDSVVSLITFLEGKVGDTLVPAHARQIVQTIGYPAWFTVNDVATLPAFMQPAKAGVNPAVDAQFFGGVLDDTWAQHEEAIPSYTLLEYLASIGCQVTLPGVEAILRRSDIREASWSGFSFSYAEVSQHLMGMLAESDHSETVTAMQRMYASVLCPMIPRNLVTAAPIWGQIVSFAKAHPERGQLILSFLDATPLRWKREVGEHLVKLDPLFFVRIWKECLAQARKEEGIIAKQRIQWSRKKIMQVTWSPERQLIDNFLDGNLQELYPDDFAFGYYTQSALFEAAAQRVTTQDGDLNDIRYEYDRPDHPIVPVVKSLVRNGLDPQEILKNLYCECVVLNPELEEELLQNLNPDHVAIFDRCSIRLSAHLAVRGKVSWKNLDLRYLLPAMSDRLGAELSQDAQQMFLLDALHSWEGSLDDLIATAATL